MRDAIRSNAQWTSGFLLRSVFSLLFLSSLLSQDPAGGWRVHAQARCGFDVVHRRMLEQDPRYRKNVEETEKFIQEYIKTHPVDKPAVESGGVKPGQTAAKSQAPIYTIPIVVHVIHTGGALGTIYNPTDATIQAVVNSLNQFYNGTGMQGAGDMQIQFALASRNNSCQSGTNGIVRYDASGNSAYVSHGVKLNGANGITDASLKGLSRWDTRNYYNIWVVNKIDGQDGTTPGVAYTGGYAYFPGVDYSLDGAVMLSTQMFSGNKTLPHEIGHAFNLEHPFSDASPTTCPTNTDCSTQGDKVCDTDPIVMPPDYFTCRTGTNPCTLAAYNDNTERNVMNYTNCYDLFTLGQKARVLASAANGLRLSLTEGYGLSSNYPLSSFTAPTGAVLPSTSLDGRLSDVIGIGQVSLNGMEFSSSYPYYDNINFGSFDRSTNCHQLIQLAAGNTYTLNLSVLGPNLLQAKAWIDYNNSGTFTNDATETLGYVVESAGTTSGQAAITFTVPNTATYRRTVRLRIAVDASTVYTYNGNYLQTVTPTAQIIYGQAEDYPVYITPPTVTWTGGAGTSSWTTASNWSPAMVPPTDCDIVIPDVSIDPVLDANRSYYNVTLQSGAVLTTGFFDLTVKGTLDNSGTIVSSSIGDLIMAGTEAQTIQGTGSVTNLRINNTSGVSIASGANLQTVTETLSPDNGTLTTNGNLTLASTATTTARVVTILNGSVSGNVNVQRYLPAGRKWRLLTAPVIGGSANSVFRHWQNNDAVIGGTGAEIWGPSGDTDPSSSNTGLTRLSGGQHSMLKYESGAWTPVTNTNSETLFDATTNKAFALFVTGPYANGTATLPTGSAATTLSATGALIQGAHIKNLGTLSANQYVLVGNPYASPVMPNSITRSNLNSSLWMWDARVSGNNNLGRYVSYSTVTSSYSVTDLASGYQNNGIPIQSGQAFFVQASSAGAASLSFQESHKTSTTTSLMFGNSEPSKPFESIRVSLLKEIEGAEVCIDGALTYFREDCNPGIDKDDGSKMMNSSENLWFRRLASNLTFDFRPTIRTTDTIRIMLGSMRQQGYRLRLEGSDFTDRNTLTARLFDRHLNRSVLLDLEGSTEYPFNVDGDPASSGDRFLISLARPSSYVQMLNISAKRKGLEVGVDWSASNDLTVGRYVVEKSTDGIRFVKMADLPSRNSTSGVYAIMDASPTAGINHYRVKAEHHDGSIKYSESVSVEFEGGGKGLTVYPNPVKDRMRVWVGNGLGARFDVRILSITGSELWRKLGISSKEQRLDVNTSGIPAGTYLLEVVESTGERRTVRFVKE